MDALGGACRVVGRTGVPLGAIVALDGIVVLGGRFQVDPTQPFLQVQKINGRATQACIEIALRPYFTAFGEPRYSSDLDGPDAGKPIPEVSLPRLEFGKTYQFRGYESGGFSGEPAGLMLEGGGINQSPGFCFRSEFVVVRGKKVPPITFAPADFLGQKVLLHGRAENKDGRAWLKGPGWEIEVLRGDVWSESMLNARVLITGVVGRDPGGKATYIRPCRARRDRLEDQVGRRVDLRGEAIEFNWRWCLRHNGQDILVENMDRLAKASSLDLHMPVEVRGVLRKEMLRDEVFGGKNDPPKERYIVREATCTPVDDLLPIERVEEPCPWSIGGP
jgi:hypothetical protein